MLKNRIVACLSIRPGSHSGYDIQIMLRTDYRIHYSIEDIDMMCRKLASDRWLRQETPPRQGIRWAACVLIVGISQR